jgi:hypothetical protein
MREPAGRGGKVAGVLAALGLGGAGITQLDDMARLAGAARVADDLPAGRLMGDAATLAGEAAIQAVGGESRDALDLTMGAADLMVVARSVLEPEAPLGTPVAGDRFTLNRPQAPIGPC